MLNDDYELTREDVQDLSSRDALAAFFAKLGYDTNERLVQNSAAMGFTGELLKSSITHIERLASQDGGLLEVYLVELKSVTVAVTRALAQAFRNLSVQQPLLVLTDDYQRLDFVLVERYSALSTAAQKAAALVPALSPAAGRQVGVRPRVLTVNRTNPGAVELRVLRRFSYTESDSFAQTDKLLSAYDVAGWSEPYFNNRALFSDYYLIQRLPESSGVERPRRGRRHDSRLSRIARPLRRGARDLRQPARFSCPRETTAAGPRYPGLRASSSRAGQKRRDSAALYPGFHEG